MGCIVALGWVIQRRGLLSGPRISRGGGPDAPRGEVGAREILATLSFTICAPALMFSTLAGTDLAHVVSRGAAVTWATTAALALLTAAVARWVLRLPAGPAAVTTLAAVYVNGGNIGIPLAVYLFDDALAVVPTLLFQLLVLAPLTLAVLDRSGAASGSAAGSATRKPRTAARSGWSSVVRVLLAAVRNPITVGTLAGLLVAVVSELTGARLPDVALIPFDLIGAAAPPLGLLTFGMTLAVPMPALTPPAADTGSPQDPGGLPTSGPEQAPASVPGSTPASTPWWTGRDRVLVRAVVALAVLVRNVLHPLAAWGVGTAVGLEPSALSP
jgi:predicted permease